MDLAKNFAKASVAAGYDASATSIAVTTGEGAKFPTVPFNVVWWNATDYGDPADDPNVEIIRVTNIATDTLTVTRAQEGTSATGKNTSGKTYKLAQTLTAQWINDLAEAGSSDGDKGDLTVSGSGSTWTIDNDVVSNAKLANVNTGTIKGRSTAGTGDPEDLTALPFAATGDVTRPAGSNAQTIAADAVDNSKLANMAAGTLKGRAAGGGSGDPSDLTALPWTATVGEGGTGATTAAAAIDNLSVAEADVASASTTDLGAVASQQIRITGTNAITSFGTAAAGIKRFCRVAGVLTLTHNGTSLILPGGANITTVAGDRFIAESLGSGNWLVLFYQKATVTGTGAAVQAASPTLSDANLTGTVNFGTSGACAEDYPDPSGGTVSGSGGGDLTMTIPLKLSKLKDSTGSLGTAGQVPRSNGASNWAWGSRCMYALQFTQSYVATILAQTYYLGPSSGAQTSQGRYWLTVPVAGRIVGYSYHVRTAGTTTAPTGNTIDLLQSNAGNPSGTVVPGGQVAFTWPGANTSVGAFQATTPTAAAVGDQIEVKFVFGGSPSSAVLNTVWFCVMIEVP